MSHLAIVLIVFAVFVVGLIGLFIRKRRRRFIQGPQRHAHGFVKYHPNTELKVKKALKPGKPDKANPVKSVAVIRFKGDIRASTRMAFSSCADEVLLNRESFSEAVVTVESPGGSVAEYGFLYGEMARLRGRGFKLTVCVDTVAASGGYLMSLPAEQILAAPFAMIGSIGVVSFVPNFRRLLEKFNIEPRTFTAGAYKRTVTFTDDASPEQVERYQEQLNLIHDQFKRALKEHRPQVELEKIATGEAWLAATTVEKGLHMVDGIRLSSDYLLELNTRQDLVEFHEKTLIPPLRRLMRFFNEATASFWH